MVLQLDQSIAIFVAVTIIVSAVIVAAVVAAVTQSKVKPKRVPFFKGPAGSPQEVQKTRLVRLLNDKCIAAVKLDKDGRTVRMSVTIDRGETFTESSMSFNEASGYIAGEFDVAVAVSGGITYMYFAFASKPPDVKGPALFSLRIAEGTAPLITDWKNINLTDIVVLYEFETMGLKFAQSTSNDSVAGLRLFMLYNRSLHGRRLPGLGCFIFKDDSSWALDSAAGHADLSEYITSTQNTNLHLSTAQDKTGATLVTVISSKHGCSTQYSKGKWNAAKPLDFGAVSSSNTNTAVAAVTSRTGAVVQAVLRAADGKCKIIWKLEGDTPFPPAQTADVIESCTNVQTVQSAADLSWVAGDTVYVISPDAKSVKRKITLSGLAGRGSALIGSGEMAMIVDDFLLIAKVDAAGLPIL